jgi:hypothetical protein
MLIIGITFVQVLHLGQNQSLILSGNVIDKSTVLSTYKRYVIEVTPGFLLEGSNVN